jgi:hypothetical protein
MIQSTGLEVLSEHQGFELRRWEKSELMEEVRNDCEIFNFSEGFVQVVAREELGPEFGVGWVDMAESAEDDSVRVVMFEGLEILSGSDVPFVVEEDFIRAQAEESFVFINLVGEEYFSVSVAASFDHIAQNVILGLECFIIKSHPSSFFLGLLEFGEVNVVNVGCWFAHGISNLNYYGLNKESNKIYLILILRNKMNLKGSTNYRELS